MSFSRLAFAHPAACQDLFERPAPAVTSQAPAASTAESLTGPELLRARLDVQRLILDDQLQEAATILGVLVGESPAAHWARTLLAFEGLDLRQRDSRRRRTVETGPFEVSFPEDPPLFASSLEAWVEDWFPYVEPQQLLQCARHARSRGRFSDAMGWYRMTVEVTPVTDPTFLVAIGGILELALRADDRNLGVLRSLEELTANPSLGAEDLIWLQAQLSTFLSFPQADGDPSSPTLLDRFPGGRLGLALHLRRGSFPVNVPELSDEELLGLAEQPLDRAALLLRSATRIRLTELPAEEVRRSLAEAAAIVPPSRTAHEIVAVLMVQRALDEDSAEPLLDLIGEHFAGPDRCWRGLLPALDDVLWILTEQDRRELLHRLVPLAMRVVQGHPFRARLLQVSAGLKEEPAQRRRLLELCLSEPRLAGRTLRPAPLQALGQLADLLHEAGETSRAADLLARRLALMPGAVIGQRGWFEEYLRWLTWRMEARELPFHVAEDAVALIGDGDALGLADVDQALEELVETFHGADRLAALIRALGALRAGLLEGGAEFQDLEFVDRALMLARTTGPLVRAALADFAARPSLPDADLYRWLEQALEVPSPAMAMRLLLAGAEVDAGAEARFSVAPPPRLRAWWQQALAESSRREELVVLCDALGAHSDVETRRVLIERLVSNRRQERSRVIRTLIQQVHDVGGIPAPERATFEPLLPLIGQGDWELLSICHALNPERTRRELRQAYLAAASTDQRCAMVRELAELSPREAEEFLVSLATFPGEDVRAAGLDALRRLRRSGHLGAIPRLLELAAADPSADVRWRVAVSFRPPLEPAEVPVLLRLIEDPETRIGRAAEARVFLLGEPALAPVLVDGLLDAPGLLDRELVREALRRATGQDLEDLEDLGPTERRALLQRLRNPR